MQITIIKCVLKKYYFKKVHELSFKQQKTTCPFTSTIEQEELTEIQASLCYFLSNFLQIKRCLSSKVKCCMWIFSVRKWKVCNLLGKQRVCKQCGFRHCGAIGK